ncbi:2-amino-4-hydroxy-6-hydroxymethyldihydropteridine diphosphokinase [Ornithinibacillus californiensis]|uniref:2-amino-4-hydroxy-6- hydroxymethyldihydropteridine diphosphokinase n=1 Tax=Ornithinibacillus californiensis TaxID=161536 RepID=UPI00064D9145|nr:2-amino-4-hydroxy-6-hydroxymethyldihydropteridine diphosphokinase [Ornithinibacillus californiensis]
MNKAFIALGTNIEPRDTHLDQAIALIQKQKDIQVNKQSSIYETAPVGYTDQADFLNMVLEIETILSPEALLEVCQGIEEELGRERVIRFGPRTIDLDILLYNNENRNSERLNIPHPRMHERGFVLIPLYEIAPEITLPTIGKSVRELVMELPAQDKKDIYKWIRAESEEE